MYQRNSASKSQRADYILKTNITFLILTHLVVVDDHESSVTRYRNCRVLVDSKGDELSVGDIWIRGGKVIDLMELFYKEKRAADVVWECEQLIAALGFIDLQVNGKSRLITVYVHLWGETTL